MKSSIIFWSIIIRIVLPLYASLGRWTSMKVSLDLPRRSPDEARCR
jgi:hypothetical protein